MIADIREPTDDVRSLARAYTAWLIDSAARGRQPGHAPIDKVFSVSGDTVTLDVTRASDLIRTGLRASKVSELVPLLGLRRKEELSHALNANGTSLWRWARDDKDLPDQTVEQILRTMQLQLFAADVFGGVAFARDWLRRPHPLLDGVSPGDYADNEFGAQKVRGLLAALKYGGVA